MASVFISHSSINKDVAESIARDLKILGHAPWLDAWEIGVGDSISRQIEKGIDGADFFILLLSQESTNSRWVDEEWRSMYSTSIFEDRAIILPCLLEDCEIPRLIRDRRYADFQQSYAIGFHEVIGAIDTFQQAAGLVTSYQASRLELPTIIRGDDTVQIMNIRAFKVKKNQLVGRYIGLKEAKLLSFNGSVGGFSKVTLSSSTSLSDYAHANVKSGTTLEDLIIENPALLGTFYGKIESADRLVISEFED